jgi:hypothetical protein
MYAVLTICYALTIITVSRTSSLRVVTASDEYKLKQWNAANKGCRSTSLGPAFGGPVNRLLQVSELCTLIACFETVRYRAHIYMLLCEVASMLQT